MPYFKWGKQHQGTGFYDGNGKFKIRFSLNEKEYGATSPIVIMMSFPVKRKNSIECQRLEIITIL